MQGSPARPSRRSRQTRSISCGLSSFGLARHTVERTNILKLQQRWPRELIQFILFTFYLSQRNRYTSHFYTIRFTRRFLKYLVFTRQELVYTSKTPGGSGSFGHLRKHQRVNHKSASHCTDRTEHTIVAPSPHSSHRSSGGERQSS